MLKIEGYDTLWEDGVINNATNRMISDSSSKELLVDKTTNDQKLIVSKMSFNHFREKLVVHFDIMFKYGEIKWPVQVRQPRSV